MNLIRILACVFSFTLLIFMGVSAQPNRSYRLDDEFSRDGISDFVFSPDGQVLAYLKTRAKNKMPARSLNPLWILFGSSDEVWLQTAPGQAGRRITDSEKDASKWWDLKWSPDGKRLAFLSTRGGNITLWIWERDKGRIRQASTQGVVLQDERGNFNWIDNHRVLFMAPLEGETSTVEENARGYGALVTLAERAWELARSGDVTASVVRNGEFNYPRRSVFLLDVDTGKGKRIADTSQRNNWWYPDFWPSPDGRYLALVSPTSSTYNFRATIRMGNPHTVELRTTDGEPIKLDRPLPENIHTQTMKWSPDGKELAFFANGPGPINPMLLYGITAAEVMPQEELKAPMENPAKLYRLNVEKKTIEQISTGEIDLGYLGAPDFMWTAGGELVFYAPKKQYGKTAGPDPSRGAPWGWSSSSAPNLVPQLPKVWMVLGRAGQIRSLSKTLAKTAGFWSVNGGRELLAVSEGEVIRLNPATGDVTNVTEQFIPKITGVYGMRVASDQLTRPNEFPPNVTKVIVSTQGGEGTQYFLDLNTGESKPLKLPAPNASLSAFSQTSGDVAYSISNSLEGTFLWRTGFGGKADKLVETNTYWKDIKLAKSQVIGYTGLDGQKYTATLTLPADYQRGRHYPVVVWVYPDPVEMVRRLNNRKVGLVTRTQADFRLESIVNGGGYVYIEPTVPSTLPAVPSDNPRHAEEAASCQYMTNGVIPAVDKLIEMGVADPDRVFLQGSSAGGWATLCIIGQTTRFKAAIAQASGAMGDFELSALRHGNFTVRYSDNPAINAAPTEFYLTFTNVPWWRDGERLRRNNPITYADRIRTPLMLMHGDLDGVPIEYSEKFFNALVSMRKTVEFVRYWGEGHAIRNPANIRDEIMRRFAWYDRWGDIARDEHGNIVWDGDRVKSRNGAPRLKPEDYAKFDFFQPSPARQQTLAGGWKEAK